MYRKRPTKMFAYNVWLIFRKCVWPVHMRCIWDVLYTILQVYMVLEKHVQWHVVVYLSTFIYVRWHGICDEWQVHYIHTYMYTEKLRKTCESPQHRHHHLLSYLSKCPVLLSFVGNFLGAVLCTYNIYIHICRPYIRVCVLYIYIPS